MASYVGVASLNQFRTTGLLNKNSRHKLTDVTDGTSNTLLFADGSAKLLPYSAASILPALASRDGGETLPDF